MNIKPLGFLRQFLVMQKDGLTGHIEKAGFPFDQVEWGKEDCVLEELGPAWWVYEQTAYWVDGFVRCAILLEDQDMLRRAQEIIYNVLNAVDADGYLGPKFMKEINERWPHAVFFRACMALFEYNGDGSILDALEKHFLGHTDFTENPSSAGRNVQNVEIVLWLYEKTGNEKLLSMALSMHESFNAASADDYRDEIALSDKKPYCHGVSYNEYSKLGALLYLHTGEQRHLQASVNAYKKVDRYFMLIDGLHASDEEMWGNGIMESHETCNVSDFTWSQYALFQATGDADYLEKAEKCVFNAGLGSVSNDFKALQYLSAVNQVLLTDHSDSSPHGYRGSRAAQYAPNPSTACCPGNVNRFMPNYILNMWQEYRGGVCLGMYGASSVAFGQGTIEEQTGFPYDDRVTLDVRCKEPFDLFLRIPKWADEMVVNGQAVATAKGGFHQIHIDSDQRIEIAFAMPPKLHTKKNYAYVTRGPLLYAFPVPTEITLTGDPDFPTYSIVPGGSWNYGLSKNSALHLCGAEIIAEGYAVDNWKLKCCKSFTWHGRRDEPTRKVNGDFLFTPTIPIKTSTDGKPCELRLIPYGRTMARIAAFPLVSAQSRDD